MIPRNNFYSIDKNEVGSEHAIEVMLAIPDATAQGGYRQEASKIQAKVISFRTSHDDPAIFLPELAYVLPTSGTMHVLEPFEAHGRIKINRVTLSINAIRKLAKFAGVATLE